jgi:hypothetical protein
MFPTYYTAEFEATLVHLKNLTSISIDNINKAVATALAISKSANKTVEEYFKDLENIKLDGNKPLTLIDNVFVTVLTFLLLQRATYCSKFVLNHHTVLNRCFPHIDQGSGPKGLGNGVSTK